MSGGSLDYACWKVDEYADEVAARAETPLHRAFADHLRLVSKALHDLEWMWSSDTSPGDEVKALEAVVSPAAVLATCVAQAEKARGDLVAALAKTPAAARNQDGGGDA